MPFTRVCNSVAKATLSPTVTVTQSSKMVNNTSIESKAKQKWVVPWL